MSSRDPARLVTAPPPLISPPLPTFSFPWLEYAGKIPEEVIFVCLSAIDNFTALAMNCPQKSTLAAEFIVYSYGNCETVMASRPWVRPWKGGAQTIYAHQEKEQKVTFRLLQRIDLRRREKNSTTNSMRRDCPSGCVSTKIKSGFRDKSRSSCWSNTKTRARQELTDVVQLPPKDERGGQSTET